MKTILATFAFAILAMTALPTAPRADENGLRLPPEGQTIINLSASERKTMPQDLLMASLRIEIDEKDPVAIQKKINEAMTEALKIAKAESALKVSTGAYSVYKYERPIVINGKTDNTQTEGVWRGSQTIDIESKDSTKLLNIVGKIQEKEFAMNNLAYTLSPEVMEKTRDELIVVALDKLEAKADIIAKALGKTKTDLIEVNVDTGGPVQPMYKAMMGRAEMAMASDAAMPAPVAEAGETDVTLTVSARALIKP